MARADNAAEKITPPYLPYKTFASTLGGWAVALPGRIDRTLFRSYSGAMQTWVIATLRYFGLIDAEGHPTPRLRKLVAAQGAERQRLLQEIVREGYGFVFAGNLDLSTATQGQIQDRFKQTSLQGDTIRKAMALFLALANEAGLTISPFMKMPRQRRANGSSPAKKAGVRKPTPATPETPAPIITTVSATTPMQVLIEMLNVQDMDEDEQAAVWTLIRYLKKGR